MQGRRFLLLLLRSMRIRDIMRCHEFLHAGLADHMAAWLGHYSMSVSIEQAVFRIENVHMARSPLLKSFLQLGHTRATDPSGAFSSVKWTSTSALSE